MKSWLRRFEKAYYESKPLLIIGIAILILLGTSWGISTLIISLTVLGYAGAILFWRLEFRGSLKKLVRNKTSDSQK